MTSCCASSEVLPVRQHVSRSLAAFMAPKLIQIKRAPSGRKLQFESDKPAPCQCKTEQRNQIEVDPAGSSRLVRSEEQRHDHYAHTRETKYRQHQPELGRYELGDRQRTDQNGCERNEKTTRTE